ncbi:MAG TPA: efflux transporter outer membrane subunit [Edaphobacter sp.]|nr:efflux transporter outer membrane subunit [Edaphobacter sp.]
MIRPGAFSAVVLLLLITGCKVGPNYNRPAVSTPGQYRGIAPDLAAQAAVQSIAETKWESVFQDESLQALIKEALINNYDMQIAATRIQQAQAIVGVTRANQLPNLYGTAGVDYLRNRLAPNGPTIDSVGIQLSYIADFWGKYRRGTEAARAQLLATTYGRSVVQTALISDVAIAYFQLRQFDYRLDFSQQAVTADKDILRINTLKYKGGESAITDVYQANLLVQQAEAEVINAQKGIEQSENQISILLGRNPGPIGRGLVLNGQPHMATVPTGLPATLLERRPDVRQSEAALMSANANVGVAKAAFFPQISLTGQFGAQSTALTSFLQGPATVWSVGAEALQPLYAGGAIRSAYNLAWAQRNEAELSYRQTVQNAFGDVSNGLVGYNQSRLFRMKIEEQTNTYQETARLANVRFKNGSTSFLEVLVTQQQYFISQLALAQAWNAELQSYVQLYQALGGGWNP